MPSDKRSKEDTWKPDDLKKHIHAAKSDSDTKKRDRPRGVEEKGANGSADSRERRHREREKEVDREKERHREKDRDKTKDRDRDRDRGKERDRNRDRDKDRRKNDERDRGKERERDRRKEEERGKDRDRDRGKERDRERDRDLERERGKDRPKEKDMEQDHKKEQAKETGSNPDKQRERHRDRQRDDERRERHREREHSRRKEEKETERVTKGENEERERRHRDRREKGERSSEEYGEYRRQHAESKDEERDRRRRERRDSDVPKEDREKRRRDGKEREHKARDKDSERKPREKRYTREEMPTDAEELSRKTRQLNPRHREKQDLGGADNERPNRERKEVKDNEQSTKRPQSEWGASQRRLSDTEEPDDETKEVAVEKPVIDEVHSEEPEDNYDEDFEDYDDDFEDDDDAGDEDGDKEEEEDISPYKRAEIEAIQRAMVAENEQIGVVQPRNKSEELDKPKRDSTDTYNKGAQRGKFIDFVAAKHREVSQNVACKQKKRSTALLRLIELDFSVSFSLLDLPPLNEYDMYIKNFGTTNTKQAYIQCNEDNTDRDNQTEEIERVEKWTQHPGESSVVCAGPSSSNESSPDSMTKLSIDSQRLSAFLRSSSQVIAVLLEEDRSEKQSGQSLRSQAASLSISDGSLLLNTNLPFLLGREVCGLHFSHVQRQTMLSVHSPSRKPSAVQLDSKSIVCVWNIWEPSNPHKVLICESEIQCCCFSPGKAILVFAGTVDGSVVVWDLREHSTLHYTMRIGNLDWTLRYPTFSTDAILATSSHLCPVRAVEPVSANVAEGQSQGFSLLSSQEETLGLSFQLASLDESGLLNLWVVMELPKANLAGSQHDLGLKPGGKVKLLHSSSININSSSLPRDTFQTAPSQALMVKFFPSDSNHFFIGTNMGLVSHGTRHGLRVPPKSYNSQMTGIKPVHVTSIDFSAFGDPVFLVGCADGSIRLHSTTTEYPIMEWNGSTNGEPIISVQWALTRPAVFFALDAASCLYIWDLLANDFQPVIKENNQSDEITTMSVFGDPGKQNSFAGISLAKQSGKIEIHYLNKQWSVPNTEEIEKLHDILNQSII
ncbi:cytoplasmic dynein 2 intermediate chain 1-like isoform X1 [Acipenser ruthenus]|uniref:cytoplasmic dynein 2 intermediate chain 1-like isoform X1 n=1 Tax=Acipenser ruthenus TaxID=7906 RepID=UPI00155F7E08|nr:cytoplasmic dynein 2 intermediate chain 1-like isoform X1 [Acipenser ruthenus]